MIAQSGNPGKSVVFLVLQTSGRRSLTCNVRVKSCVSVFAHCKTGTDSEVAVKKTLASSGALLLILAGTGCAGRLMKIGLPDAPTQPATPPDSSTLGSWENLQHLKPGSRIAVYLENGGRMVQRFLAVNESRLVLDINGVERDRVVAVALAPDDRLRDGVLAGSGIGAGIGIGMGAVFTEDGDELSAAAVTAGLVYGLGIGAGVGTLLDSGLATRERALYVRGGAGKPLTPARTWTLKIPRHQLFRWIEGRKLDLMLHDAAYLKGKVIHGTEHEIEFQVADASEKSYRGRRIQISTDRISTVAYRENIGGNRLAAAIGGGLGGFFSGALLGASADQDSAHGLVIGTGVGTLVGSMVGLGLAEQFNWREVMLIIQ
jgi:hypothetical protein